MSGIIGDRVCGSEDNGWGDGETVLGALEIDLIVLEAHTKLCEQE